MPTIRSAYWVVIAGALALLAGCNTTSVRSTTVEPVRVAPAAAAIPEHLLLDVNVAIFDPGIDTLDPKRTTTTPGIRRAEGHYVAQRLKDTLEQSTHWGTVRVVPEPTHIVDVMVSGKILKSNGETLEVIAEVNDARGQQWFSRTYKEAVSRFAYDAEIRRRQEPFQNLYNRIASDMLDYLAKQEHDTLAVIRQTSELRFAASFAPEVFGDYLETDSRGRHTVVRLPAENDPLLERIRRIRVRDGLFIDRLQDSYDEFDRSMLTSYDYWRLESYTEAEAADELNSQALARTVGGALAVIGGILAQTSSSSAVRSAGVVGIGGGALAVKSGFDKRAEARIHTEAMKELSQSLNAEVQPQTIALTDRNVELKGTVEEQYAQWQALLRDIYLIETGQAPAAPLASDAPAATAN